MLHWFGAVSTEELHEIVPAIVTIYAIMAVAWMALLCTLRPYRKI